MMGVTVLVSHHYLNVFFNNYVVNSSMNVDVFFMQSETVGDAEQADTAVQLATQAGSHAALRHQVQQQAAAIAALQAQLLVLQQAAPVPARDMSQSPAHATSALSDSSLEDGDTMQAGKGASPANQAATPMGSFESARSSMQQAAGTCTDGAHAGAASQSVGGDCCDSVGAGDQQMMLTHNQQLVPSSDQHMVQRDGQQMVPNYGQQVAASQMDSEPDDETGGNTQVEAGPKVPTDTEQVTSRQAAAKQETPKAKKPCKSTGGKQSGGPRRTHWFTNIQWCNAPHRFL